MRCAERLPPFDKALQITPALTEFIVATTANDDLEYDRIANTLSQEQAALGRRIDVQVWGWDTLQPKIRANKAALDAFDPGHSASTDRIVALGEESLERHGETQAAVDRGGQGEGIICVERCGNIVNPHR